MLHWEVYSPAKETDLLRRCNPSELYVQNMLDLLREDYLDYMSDRSIYYSSELFLSESNIRHRSYSWLRKLFDESLTFHKSHDDVLEQIKSLSLSVTGRDIFKQEIAIVDGHDSSSYFWIKPVRVIDYTDTNGLDNVAEMDEAEISIEEGDVERCLTPFLYKYYDDELEANKNRADVKGFEWYLTHNFYTHDSVRKILADIRDTIDALSSGRENEFTVKLREKISSESHELLIDFYRRLIYRMEYMLKIGREKGYDLISVMGP